MYLHTLAIVAFFAYKRIVGPQRVFLRHERFLVGAARSEVFTSQRLIVFFRPMNIQ